MTARASQFDGWIRTDFVALNTELEELYFALDDREDIESVGTDLKRRLVDAGRNHIVALLAEGNTDEGFEANFNLMGNIGLYMAACRRHLITEPTRETRSPLIEASALAMQVGASIGMVPRFVSSHLETHNFAINGVFKTFTSLRDEQLFIAYNTRAALAYIRAAESLLHVLPLGVSHPVTADLLIAARDALEDVYRSNDKLFDELDMERFFHCVRTYYKPHRVGLHEYRGANAGDFAGINVIDLLLGVCRADEAFYSQLLIDKFLFMRPEDQLVLRDCMRRKSLLDSLLEYAGTDTASEWYQRNTRLFLEVCAAHGKAALQHHEKLVRKFIEDPALNKGLANQKDMTASGPPLPVLLKSLRKLADLRAATDRSDIPSRYADLERLRTSIGCDLAAGSVRG
ncbi:MAG: DUF1864 family protein [Steroidobacteraceae bacterium]